MALIDELRARLDADCIEDDPDVVAAYTQDRAIFERSWDSRRGGHAAHHRRRGGVPGSRPIGRRPRGHAVGTGLCGGANAVDECVVLSMHRMNRVLHVDTANRMAHVQPGVSTVNSSGSSPSTACSTPDPASYEISSVGGNVATARKNAGGCLLRALRGGARTT